MTSLATRIEAAQPGQEDDMLEELWDACQHAWGGYKVRARFRRMLDAEAWLSAVEMLVPEGCLHMARTVWENAAKPLQAKPAGYASIDSYFADENGLMWKENFLAIAATPALALAAAIARSIGHE